MGFAKLLTPLIQHVPSGSKRRESTPTPSADRPSSIATPATSSFPRSAPTEVSSLNSELSQQAPGVAASFRRGETQQLLRYSLSPATSRNRPTGPRAVSEEAGPYDLLMHLPDSSKGDAPA